MPNPLVSIVVCCYNRAQFLEETLASVFAQTYEPVEIIVYDDGSIDETPELIRKYGDKLTYHWHENKGAADTRTAACRLANGEFIAFQDDDDLMPPNRIALLYEQFVKYPDAVLAFGNWQAIDQQSNNIATKCQEHLKAEAADGPLLIEDGYRAIMWGNRAVPLPHTSLFRKSDGEKAGWFDNRFFNAIEDTDFFARLGKLGPIVYVPEVMSFYRQGHNQMVSKKGLLAINRFLLFEKHLQSLTDSETQMKKRLRRRLLDVLRALHKYEEAGFVSDKLPGDYQARGLKLLGLKELSAYRLFQLTGASL